MRALLLGTWLVIAATPASASAQQRVFEIAADVGPVGSATRDLGFVRAQSSMRPAFGLALRLTGRVLSRPGFGDLHLGAHLGATLWRTDALAQAEGAFRGLCDLGVFVRWRRDVRLSPTVAFSAGPTLGVPSIAELYAGVPFGLGMYTDLALGLSLRAGRSALGAELAYAHHRVVTPALEATTLTHALVIRLGFSWSSAPTR